MVWRNLKMILEYDGTDFHGWNKQPGLRTIQGELEKALEILTGDKISVSGAGRTDAGVHALGQTANFTTKSTIPVKNFGSALNFYLAEGIYVKEMQEVDLNFHARKSAKSREYIYRLASGSYWPFVLKRFTHFVPEKLDLSLMQKAADGLIGIKEIYDSKVRYERLPEELEVPELQLINFWIKARRFLYKMVRKICGILVEVGRGKIEPEKIGEILEGNELKPAFRVAPGQGLYLFKVNYE